MLRYAIVAACILPVAAPPAHAGTLTVLHNFTGGADGNYPYGQTVRDKAGNTYGVALYGANNCTSKVINAGDGCGTLWKVDAGGTFSVLVTFAGAANGAVPTRLALHGGKLVGATAGGGATDNGVVFSVGTTGKHFAILHAFNGTDGCSSGTLAFDAAGDLFAGAGCGANNNGEIYKISAAGVFSVLTSGAAGGARPGRPIVGPKGLLYAMFKDPTCASGATGCGLLNSVDPVTGAVTLLSNLAGTEVGTQEALEQDAGGTLYAGQNAGGGAGGGQYGWGSFFAYTPSTKKLTVLHQINQQTDGWAPNYLSRVSAGTFYATSFYGSLTGNHDGIFSLTKAGVYTDLYDFNNLPVEGGYPASEPVWDATAATLYGSNALYGPSSDGKGNCISPGGQSSGYGCGTVWSFKP